jgi:hypothetical protein
MSKILLPVIQFEPDGYVLDSPKLMGRQSARVFTQIVKDQAPELNSPWARSEV